MVKTMTSAPQLQQKRETSRTAECDISGDDLFDILANQRRRFVVHMLKRRGEPIELGPMAEQIAAWENDIELAEVKSRERKRVYTSLQQTHLPQMDDANVIEFNKQRGVIKPTETLTDADVYMDIVQGKDIPWSTYYLGLSVTGLLAVGAAWGGVWPMSVFSELSWAVFITTVFVFSALVHRYLARKTTIGSKEKPPELYL